VIAPPDLSLRAPPKILAHRPGMLSTGGMKELEEGRTPRLDFTKLKKVAETGHDLLPVVVQDARTGEVLILAYANEQALRHSLDTGEAAFWSSSRNELWVKGKTSGDILRLEEVRVNCEQNSLLYLVTPLGKGACHTKNEAGRTRSGCYYRRMTSDQKLEFVEPESRQFVKPE
jgi:phosphoribosyl-AMP cyclohydrolase